MKSLIIRSVSMLAVIGAVFVYNHAVGHISAADRQADAGQVIDGAYKEGIYSDEMDESGMIQRTMYIDGTYSGEAEGFGGEISVLVTVTGGALTDIEIVSADGEGRIFLKRAQKMIPEMIRQQSAGVDAVSGATFSCEGIKNAVSQALEEAVSNE